jgi:hypothetical protein
LCVCAFARALRLCKSAARQSSDRSAGAFGGLRSLSLCIHQCSTAAPSTTCSPASTFVDFGQLNAQPQQLPPQRGIFNIGHWLAELNVRAESV